MSFVKRLSQILTPPIWRRQSPSTPGAGDEFFLTEGPRVSEVKETLECLLDPGDRTADITRQMLDRLKEIAKKYGRVNTAHEIRDSVLRMPEQNAAGRSYKKGRGFELAADLLVQHVQRQLQGLDAVGSAEGVGELAALVGEILDCLLLAKKPIKGIELCLDIADELVQRVCFVRASGSKGLRVAEQILAQTLEACLLEHEELERAKKLGKPRCSEEAVELNRLNNSVLAYLSQKKKSVDNVGASLVKLGIAPGLGSREAVMSASAAELTTHGAFLMSMAQSAANTGNYFLASYGLEQAATVLRRAGRPEAESCAAQAVLMYEKSAVTEQEVGLYTRAARHRKCAVRFTEEFQGPKLKGA